MMENFDTLRLDGHALRVFVAVCETGSVSKTADLFNLNQSTISHTLEKLRSAIGDPLFVKAGRGITPTETALTLLPRVEKLIAELESLAVPERFDPATDTRRIVIGIQTPALLQDIKLLRARIAAEAPLTVLELRRIVPRERIPEMLQAQEMDLAIVVSSKSYAVTLNKRAYGQDKMVVFYDPDHRGPIETVEDYAAAQHGVVSFGGSNKSFVETALEQFGQSRRVTLVAPTASMLGDLIKGTDIIATMPSHMAGSVYSGLAHCDAPLALPNIKYDLLWHRRHEHSGRNIWLRELVQDVGLKVYGPHP